MCSVGVGVGVENKRRSAILIPNVYIIRKLMENVTWTEALSIKLMN